MDNNLLAQRAVTCAWQAIQYLPLEIECKGPGDYVTSADRIAGEEILSVLASSSIPVLMEDSCESVTSSCLWVVDPIDGTANFMRGDPHWAISVALWSAGHPVVAAILAPRLRYRFVAEVGKGAYCYSIKQLGVSKDRLRDSLVGHPHLKDYKLQSENDRILNTVGHIADSVRVCGSAVLGACFVAMGWWGAYWHPGLKPWDGAAATLIVREAGGRVTDLEGEEWGLDKSSFLATNGPITEEILTWIRR